MCGSWRGCYYLSLDIILVEPRFLSCGDKALKYQRIDEEVKVMSKSVTNFSRNGVSDWLVQRVSAVVLTVYLVVLVGWSMFCSDGGYQSWYGFMMSTPMKVFSILAVLSLVSHAWIGLWAISTDYLKQACVRLAFQIVTVLALLVYLIWALIIFLG